MGAGTGEDAACRRSVPGGAGRAAGRRQRCESWVGTVVSGVGGEGQDAGPAGGGQCCRRPLAWQRQGRRVISTGVTVEHLGPTESHQGQDWRFDEGRGEA